MTIPYTQIDADLVKLAQQRTGEAIRSVVQLADTPGQAFQIALGAMSTAIASAAGTYAAFKGLDPTKVDNLELAIAIIHLLRETSDA